LELFGKKKHENKFYSLALFPMKIKAPANGKGSKPFGISPLPMAQKQQLMQRLWSFLET
jgi:hypothetical protein